jgi:hypothetical protein
MRILILNADYDRFLHDLYARTPGLRDASYAAQMQARNDSLFGVADFYSRNFRLHGHDAREIHTNNDIMQAAWAHENDITAPADADRKPGLRQFAKSLLRPILGPLKRRLFPTGLKPHQAAILLAQIEAFNPDVILNQEMGFIRSNFLNSLKRPGRVILGQIAAALPHGDDFSAYDLVITSLPNFVDWFRTRGIKAQLNRLGFDASVLDRMGPPPPRNIDISFVGSLSPEHEDRIHLLEQLALAVPLKVWGNNIERLPKSSPLHPIYQGEAWGREMYDVLRRSRITLNRHIGLAGDHANNMRLYEATGMGAMLLTDMKCDLADIFRLGSEVVAYGSLDECVTRIRQYLADDVARVSVAEQGQRRTLRDHSNADRTKGILELIGISGRTS